MASELPILYNKTVYKISQDKSYTTVYTDNQKLTAKYVVVTGAPSIVNKINYDPPLPFLKAELFQKVSVGNAIRMSAVYPTPFWRSKGLSGSLGDENLDSLLPIAYDMT